MSQNSAESAQGDVTDPRNEHVQVCSADEAFVTGALGGVTPVTRIDGRQIGRGVPGELSALASSLYVAEVLGG